MIIQNAVKIKEKGKSPVYIKSLTRHDFRTHVFPNGSYVSVDGGTDYLRRAVSNKKDLPKGAKITDYSLTDENAFRKIKSRLLWGTYGKNGKKFRFVPLCECSRNHLKKILKTVPDLDPMYEKVIYEILIDKVI